MNAPAVIPKVSAKGRYVKGRSFEYEIVHFLREGGLESSRVWGSGSGYEKGDIRVTWRRPLKGEAKRKACLPKWIKDALGNHDFMAMRCDRGEPFVMIRLPFFRELLVASGVAA